jgi:hypothetical protein
VLSLEPTTRVQHSANPSTRDVQEGLLLTLLTMNCRKVPASSGAWLF